VNLALTIPPGKWPHSVSIRRQAVTQDTSAGMLLADADGGQTVVCHVQELQGIRPVREEQHGTAIVSHREFDILVPVTNPTTGQAQFPTGVNVVVDDLIVWGTRKLWVTADVDPAGRGGKGLVLTITCREVR